MEQYVTLDKRSKKAQKEYHAKQRRTWGELNPVTRSVPSGKVYNRKKEKQRIGVESGNEELCQEKVLVIDIIIEVYLKKILMLYGNHIIK